MTSQPAKEPEKEYWIKSATTPGKIYSVFNGIHKGWRCTCMWWTQTQSTKKDCRHIKQAKYLEKHPNRQIKNG